MEPGGSHTIWTSTHPPSDQVTALVARKDGSLWFAIGDGAFHRHVSGTLENVILPERSDAIVWSLVEDSENNLWCGTDSGLVRLRESALQVVNSRSGLSNRNVWAVSPAAGGWSGGRHIARVATGNLSTPTHTTWRPATCVGCRKSGSLAGDRVVYGFVGAIMGKLDKAKTKAKSKSAAKGKK